MAFTTHATAPLRLYENGKRVEGVVKMFLANVRLPDQIAGDLAAMTNVFQLGRRGLDDLIARYGAATLRACIDEMMQRSERQMRAHISDIPDGSYHFVDYFDNDGIVDEPLKVELSLTVDGSFGALAQAIPARTPATPYGTTGVTTISGRRDDGRYYVAVFPYPGGYGGSAASDGLVNGTLPSSLAGFMSVEMSEHRYPIRFQYLSIREDSAGAGEYRGGCGTCYAITALDDCLVSVLGDRVDHAPFGVNGGGAAETNSVRFNTKGESWVPPMRSKIEKVPMKSGDSVYLASPGGGGFGDPAQRSIEAIERDLNRGLINPESAEDKYRAVIEKTSHVGERGRYTVRRR